MAERAALYDRIGLTYSTSRTADPRLSAAIHGALGDARSVVNVGAGTGDYEPFGLDVIAIEPSEVMIAQRPAGSAQAIRGVAEALPLEDASVDAAMAIISDHHWTDRTAGLREMRRVARKRIVLLNSDPSVANGFWLTRDYLPGFLDLIPEDCRAPGYWRQELQRLLGDIRVHVIPVPHDCTDGFYQAYWRRPSMYLRADVHRNISVFHRLPATDVSRAVQRLSHDLDNGTWHKRHDDLTSRPELDVGLRLVVAELG